MIVAAGDERRHDAVEPPCPMAVVAISWRSFEAVSELVVGPVDSEGENDRDDITGVVRDSWSDS